MSLLNAVLLPVLLLTAAPQGQGAMPQPTGKWMKRASQGKDLYATFHTSLGDIVVRLFPKDAPLTVENFVGLASGEKAWTDRSGQPMKKPLYNGTVFHRVIPGFMIQGGDPEGTGMGSPGYTFQDEFQSGRKFTKPGLLAMANRGPNTNGSQFFITVSTPTHLNNRHTIFGEVISGYDVAVKISEVPRGAMDRPNTDVVLKSVELSEKPPKGAASGMGKAGAKAPAGKKQTEQKQ
jgi:peptidyl-prolyl cis-trans isomerase A (cyclophilin A)